jgi:hypothetical protein
VRALGKGDGTMGIFLSYRRNDGASVAGRLADRLIERYGRSRVFLDVESLDVGVNFVEEILAAIRNGDAFMLFIGPTWVTAENENGRRRLDDPDDVLVLEIREALRCRVPIVPLLLDGAEPLNREDLPAGLESLSQMEAEMLAHKSFGYDVDRLLDRLEKLVPPASRVKAGQYHDLRPGADLRHPDGGWCQVSRSLDGKTVYLGKLPGRGYVSHELYEDLPVEQWYQPVDPRDAYALPGQRPRPDGTKVPVRLYRRRQGGLVLEWIPAPPD